MSKTIFCDIDGCLIEHQNYYTEDAKILDGTKEKLKDWDRKGYRLILTTGRRESARAVTEKMLHKNNITYDYLIMGLGPNVRVLINDLRDGEDIDTAVSINLPRNVGIKNLDL
tara:strand:+ start:672 stop:1010 length:339 start_codon:yes stop_codon:yes gene_type:complete